MHFVGLVLAFLSSGGDFGTGFGSPFTSVPGVVGPVGGFVSFETILELGRPIHVPGGLVQLGGAGVLGISAQTTRGTRHATVDVSHPASGGTIQFVGAVGFARRGSVALGKRGGEARAKRLRAEQRSEIASKAAKARWKKSRRDD